MTSPYEKHDVLFTDNGLKLGKILWYLLSADQEMAERTHVQETTEQGPRPFPKRTPFGEEVGNDEIFWWIYRKESNIEEFRTKVANTLGSAQTLRERVRKLDASNIQTYDKLVETLAQFIDTHKKQIADVYEFVLWLHERDSLAPVILFTYRVWGSSRMSDRFFDIQGSSIDSEPDGTVERLTEIACGLFRRGDYTRFYEMMDIDYAIYESDPENSQPRHIPQQEIDSRTARRVIREFDVFWEFLRNSLRNIELDIEKYLSERDLLKSESFWANFIMKAKDPSRVESTLWDFKQSLSIWHTTGPERQKAQIDFCKLVAAFANRDGGAIVVGVHDETRAVEGVPQMENRMKSISEVVERYIGYPRINALVHLQQVPMEEAGKASTCLVVAVAQSEDVVSVKNLAGAYYYPDRDQTGVANRDLPYLQTRKVHLKAGDNYGFVKTLNDFLHDR